MSRLDVPEVPCYCGHDVLAHAVLDNEVYCFVCAKSEPPK